MEFLKSLTRIFNSQSSPKKKGNTTTVDQQQNTTDQNEQDVNNKTTITTELNNKNENGANISTTTTTATKSDDLQSIKDEIFSIDFSSFSKNKQELIECSRIIFEEAGIAKYLNADKDTLERYLSKVRETYRDNPFHSFNHAVTVTQMIFLIIIKTQLINTLTPMEKLAILVASVCHDLDHPGLNNKFQINIKSELALLYNNKSVLENHHLSQCLMTLNDKSGKDLLSTLTQEDRDILYEKVRILILATDMENHFVYKEKFDNIIPIFDWNDQQHRELLLIMLLKSADISNELRTWDVSSKWANALMQEFFNQSDLEKENNLPLTPFMVREKVILNSTQVSFIDKFLLPTYQALQNILPPLSVFIERINQNRQVWETVQS